MSVTHLIDKVETMVAESGSPGFDARAWIERWIQEPVPALGGARPIELMETEEGREQVSTLLDRMQSGAFS